jgi:8-oxo-dGTP pyrophosphatase MutT (NUDIX family)
MESAGNTKLPHTCRNCGLVGHLYRDCPHPIMSFGLICYKKNKANKIEYLMIQRKDSLSFMEFIRGKYSLSNIEYIKKLLSYMTHQERKVLETASFQELWNIIWFQPHAVKHSQEYTESKIKFDSLKHGFLLKPATGTATATAANPNNNNNKGTLVLLRNLLQSTQTVYTEPEWGFPKGRRKLKEEDMDCGVREFCEESGFERGDLEVHKNLMPLEEFFYGTNNILYRHVYYLARIVKNEDKAMTINLLNPHQAREVRKAQWFSYNEVMERIRPYNTERRNLFKEAHRIIHELHGMSPSVLSVDSTEFKPQSSSIFTTEKLSNDERLRILGGSGGSIAGTGICPGV